MKHYVVILLFGVCVLLGCSREPKIKYIVPVGYRGVLKVDYEVPNETIISNIDGTITLIFPPNGILKLKSKSPRTQWHIPTPQYADGTPILDSGAIGNDNPNAIEFRFVGSKPSNEDCFVIGTLAEEKAAREQFFNFKFPK